MVKTVYETAASQTLSFLRVDNLVGDLLEKGVDIGGVVVGRFGAGGRDGFGGVVAPGEEIAADQYGGHKRHACNRPPEPAATRP